MTYPDRKRSTRSLRISVEYQWHQQQSVYHQANIVGETNRSQCLDHRPEFHAIICVLLNTKGQNRNTAIKSNAWITKMKTKIRVECILIPSNSLSFWSSQSKLTLHTGDTIKSSARKPHCIITIHVWNEFLIRIKFNTQNHISTTKKEIKKKISKRKTKCLLVLTLMGELHRKSINSVRSFGGSWWTCVWYFVYRINSVFLQRSNASLSTLTRMSCAHTPCVPTN